MVVARGRGSNGGSRVDDGCVRERLRWWWCNEENKRNRMREVRSGGNPMEKRKERGVWLDEEKKRKRMREVNVCGEVGKTLNVWGSGEGSRSVRRSFKWWDHIHI